MAFHRAIPLDAQLRVKNEKDTSAAIFVDLRNGVIRVRRLQSTLVVRLKSQTVEWIRKRDEEGAKLRLAFLGVEKRRGKGPTYGKLYVALIFAREVQLVEPKAIVVMDMNRLDSGIVAGVVKDGNIVKRMRLPDEGAIKELRRLHERISHFVERAVGDSAKKARLEKIARYLKSKRYAKIRGAVEQIAGEIVKLVMEYKPARRYGLPCLELYSTVCLRYGAKLQELKNRKTTRPSYSFNDHRDNIPSIWAKRRYWEIFRKVKQLAFPLSAAISLYKLFHL